MKHIREVQAGTNCENNKNFYIDSGNWWDGATKFFTKNGQAKRGMVKL